MYSDSWGKGVGEHIAVNAVVTAGYGTTQGGVPSLQKLTTRQIILRAYPVGEEMQLVGQSVSHYW